MPKEHKLNILPSYMVDFLIDLCLFVGQTFKNFEMSNILFPSTGVSNIADDNE